MFRLIEEGVPALSYIIIVMTLRQWDFFLRWVVVEDFFWLFLGRNHAFNLVQDLFIYVCLSSTLFLSTLVMLALVVLLLRLLQHIFGVHFAEDGRDSRA